MAIALVRRLAACSSEVSWRRSTCSRGARWASVAMIWGDECVQRRALSPDGDRPGAAGRGGLGTEYGALQLGDEALGAVAHLLASGCESDAAAGPGEQLSSDCVLEASDLLRQAGLGDAEALGGPPEVQFLGHG